MAVVDLSAEAADVVAATFNGCGYAIDAGDEASIQDLHGKIESTLGAVDILVNSAVVFQAAEPATRLSMSHWDKVVRVSQRATFLACAVFGGGLPSAPSGN